LNARADRFFLVDSLRGVAALMVLAVHVAWFSGAANVGSWMRPYSARFEAAFAIFFAISGFLLYRPFVKARLLDRPALSARAYGWRRFLRIVPAFWVALTVVAIWRGSDVWSAHEIARNYGFLQLYYGAGIHDIIPQAWTLSVEVAFYAALPAWAWLMRRVPARDFDGRLRVEVVAVSALVLGSLAYNASLVYSHAVERITYAPVAALAALPGYMDHIALGMLLAVLSVWVLDHRGGRMPRPLAFLARFPSVCWAVAVAAVVLGARLLELHDFYTPTEYMARHLLNSVVAVAVLVPAVFGDPRKGLTRRLLGNPALVYLGLISYGFYLFHWAVVDQLFRWKLSGDVGFLDSYAAWYVTALAGAIVLGSLSYYLVERPALSLKGLVSPKPQQDRDEALAEPAPVAPVTAPPA
jgi:peptidoglycan/LPS O-acetylase OafA/YrhL